MRKTGLKSVARCLGYILCTLLVLFNYSDPVRSLKTLPDTLYISQAEQPDLSAIGAPFYERQQEALNVSGDLSESLGNDKIEIDLFGVIPFKEVSVFEREPIEVMPGGQSVGVTIYTDGTLVVGLEKFQNQQGEYV